MHRAYHHWDSPALSRPMELLVFGHAGAPVIVFPTSQGRFFEYEDRGMVAALGHHLEQGWVQLYCLDSVDSESWYARWAHPRGRLHRHDQYERYVLDEVLPFIRAQNPNPFTMLHGCSFGASHAMLFGLRHPHLFNRVIALSGYFDMRHFTDGYYDEEVYYHNPLDFIAGLQEGQLAQDLRRLEIIMAIGRDDDAAWTNARLSELLWARGIWHAMRWWDGWAHDWPYWRHMIQIYINGAD
ncbi:MAG TPA: alpha/beta hydrolase-fold protein [Roseiflexaceae bacterium]|nr:alpha/beta hydrolase-fold protein [Roseiflexaceae bacterium]